MSLSQFIWHIKYVEKQDNSVISFFCMKYRSVPAGWKPYFLVHRAQFWRRVPDAQANLHGSAKNGQNVDKKQKKRPVSAKCMN